MTDFKNNPEIVKNIEHYLPDENIKISLVICCWGTSHLLKRSVETYCQQDFPVSEYEIIAIDDCSFDDVYGALQFAIGKINLRYIRLDHPFKMRGNTMAFNTGFAWAKGSIIAESTPETLLTKDCIRTMYETVTNNERAFCSMKTYNLTPSLQLAIDTVDWRENIYNIKNLEGFNNDWTLNNEKTTHFGTHQTCAIKKELFYELFPNGFPLYGDWGSEDPKYAGTREANKVKDITIMQPMMIHQHHLPFGYFVSLGYAPMLNKYNHSMSNFMNDTSGEVPDGGTAKIWDRGSQEQMSEEEKRDWRQHDEYFLASGGDPKYLTQK